FLLLIEQRRWPLVRVRRHWFGRRVRADRKSTRLNSSHVAISYAVFCLNKKRKDRNTRCRDHASGVRRTPKAAVQKARELYCPLRPDDPATVFFNDTENTEIHTLSLHDALPI